MRTEMINNKYYYYNNYIAPCDIQMSLTCQFEGIAEPVYHSYCLQPSHTET